MVEVLCAGALVSGLSLRQGAMPAVTCSILLLAKLEPSSLNRDLAKR